MKLKKLFLLFIIGGFLGFIFIIATNIIIDPFGVFGDRFLKWDSYSMTQNPRLGKIAYLDKYNKNYNSYIIGSSKTSSLSPTQLNKYYDDAKFFNMLMYGADLSHIEKTVYYLIDNYEVKNIVLNLGISELITYNNQTTDPKEELHAKVSGSNLFKFYLKYLFISPQYSIDKINDYSSYPKEQKPSKEAVFIPELGVYDKSLRDKENSVNINDYVNEVGANTFLTYGKKNDSLIADNCIESIKNIEKYCESNNVSLKIISSPNYELELMTFDLEKVREYWIELSQFIDFWNFSGYNSISQDPRFFYDSVHFRNNIGESMLGKVFDDKTIYVPQDFGVFMTKNNSAELSKKLLTPNKDLTDFIDFDKKTEQTNIPILMYHNIVENNESLNLATVTKEKFESDMKKIKAQGFNAVSFKDIVSYVETGEDLPEKPIIITFDDGYKSNYTYAFPILKQLDMKATINIIGWSVGRDMRLNEIDKITPHFSYEEAVEMANSGIIEICSHSYNMHETGEVSPFRFGVKIKDSEQTKTYYDILTQDINQQKKMYGEFLNNDVFSYPYGASDVISERILKENGYKVTLLTGNKISTIKKGKLFSLFGLYRINISPESNLEDFDWFLN